MVPFQTSLWSSGLGMKLEAVTPFLGKYRPFVGRCCQTCTPKSWVSDVELGPTLRSLGELGCGSHSSGKQRPGSALPACTSALVFQGNRGTGAGCAIGLGLARGPGGVGWGSAEGPERRLQSLAVQFGGTSHSESPALSIVLKTCASMLCTGADGIRVVVETQATCSVL